ncbi:dipeptidyl peptidase 2 isoform X1 [Dunckerocampus dactyliophorus]|uniref:dipeptidyl peptidase 2 isoform X1 n=2 Tax=Dunckerocampus dactyliophorus TaxID=161453 RepID=UPI0024070117|nr:dipeptidyl peptidase 2 isoform X1 [Dunckerocampus dactyliophorus]
MTEKTLTFLTIILFNFVSTEIVQALSHSRFQTGIHGFRAQASFKEKYFIQSLDHFNFNAMGNGTFLQRYLITDEYWKAGYGPIFFYTGNEGDIWEFALNTGFLIELAAQQDALLIFAEHRYYGKSLPFGNNSFNLDKIGLLTVEQAIADYAVMISMLKHELAATDCPVIVFGGSYGGMLSVYMRIKYPNLVTGALAASAPILSVAGLGDPGQFFRDVTSDFENIVPECRDAVKGAFHQLKELGELQDYMKIQSAFTLCKRPSSAQDIQQLNGLLRNAFTLMAMLDYPYSTHFMGNMPANPVKVACDTMLRGADLLANLRDSAGIVYNSSGVLTCFDLNSLFVKCADPTGCGLGFNSLAWDYQACTEINLCYESNNITDMFPAMTFSETERMEYCSKRWGVIPRPDWLKIQFWGNALSTASNIIFSNGDLDPWANGGVRKSLSSALIAINISGGAHHLDLRGSNDADPASVIKARKTEADLITYWVQTARTMRSKQHLL